ncbi:MAG: type IV pili twitching motility protein PilT, partial [Synechococcus sp. TMED20]
MAQPVFPPSFPPRPAAPSGPAKTSAPPQPQVARQTPPGGSAAGSATAPSDSSSPSLEQIVRLAHDEGHSDVHLGVGEIPRYRARGEMLRTEWPITDQTIFQGWLGEILSPQQIDEFFREKEFDGSHAFPFVRIRINLLDSLRGPAMVLRLIPQTILTMEQLKLPEVLRELAARPKGLILVTGPTGSGKSTTLA